jgi:hypothetical protein
LTFGHPVQRATEPPFGGGFGGGEGITFGDLAGSSRASGTGTNRLNLLLSCACWRPDSWVDRLPRLLDPLGVRSVRAQSARHAERLIRSVDVHLAVVDLGLPLDEPSACVQTASRCVPASPPDAAIAPPDAEAEEGGTRILELLARLPAPPPTVVVQAPRSHRDAARAMHAALKCGAFAVVDRSAAEVEFMLSVMHRCLTKFYGNRWPGRGAGGPTEC